MQTSKVSECRFHAFTIQESTMSLLMKPHPQNYQHVDMGPQLNQKDPDDQQTEGDAQSQDSSSELKPRILDVISICKTEAEDRELGHQKDVSSAGEQRLFPQFDSSSTDETLNRNAPTVATPRVKIEPEDTIITITSSVTTTPAHAGPCQDSEPAHQMRTASDASTLLRRPQKRNAFAHDTPCLGEHSLKITIMKGRISVTNVEGS